MVKKEVEKLLKRVQKPARYTGGELNSVIKNKEDVSVKGSVCMNTNNDREDKKLPEAIICANDYNALFYLIPISL